MAIKQAKIITVTSVKGGTGKTVTTLNLAGIISKLNKKVLIIDLDLYSSSIAMSLNLDNEKDIYKLIYDIKNNKYTTIEDYTENYNDFVSVLPSPKDPRFANKIGIKYINIVLDKAKSRYDYILIDTNHTLSDLNLLTYDSSDLILYLITSDIVCLKNMHTMISIYSDMKKDNYRIILNNSILDKSKYSKYDIKQMINHDIDYIIPNSFYIKNIDEYVMNGKIPSMEKKYKNQIKSLEKLVNDLNED